MVGMRHTHTYRVREREGEKIHWKLKNEWIWKWNDKGRAIETKKSTACIANRDEDARKLPLFASIIAIAVAIAGIYATFDN